MEILIIWLLCGVACALIAGAKNRNALGWLFLGCIFGIFALIVVAVMPKLEGK